MSEFQKVRVCSKTDIGIKREKKEDSYLIIDDQNESFDIKFYGRIYTLADAMGEDTPVVKSQANWHARRLSGITQDRQ